MTTKPVDDPTIAALVRDIATGWTMPQQRLGALTWSDRVGERHARSAEGRRSWNWPRPLARGALTAAIGTVALAFVAVWLTNPQGFGLWLGSSGASSQPGAASAAPGTTPQASQGPAATPFPALTIFGAPLPDTRLLVETGLGFHVLDMSSGRLGPGVVSSELAALATNEVILRDGRALCLCGFYSVQDGVDYLMLEIRWFDANGVLERIQPVATYAGWAGPTSSGSTLPGVYARGTLTPDGNSFIVGRTSRELSAWRSGIDLVNIATGQLTELVTLPDLELLGVAGTPTGPSGSQGSDVYPWAPRIALSPDGLGFVATQYVTVEERIANVYRFSGELDIETHAVRITPTMTGPGTLGAEDCFSFPDEAFASNEVYAGLCSSSGRVILRRVARDGSPLGDTELAATNSGGAGMPGNAWVTDPAAAIGYYWNAFNRTVVKVDLPSGRILARATLPDATASARDPLGALADLGRSLGAWLAPTALAKTYFEPALALAPDGSRLYLLATHASDPLDTAAGSAGVWVVDSATLGVVDHWEPTADFVSIAVSRDGSYVYAAGVQAGVSDSGTPHEMSVTAFDSADGTVRAIAGTLGSDWLSIRGVISP